MADSAVRNKWDFLESVFTRRWDSESLLYLKQGFYDEFPHVGREGGKLAVAYT